jgi:hypothetical protein
LPRQASLQFPPASCGALLPSVAGGGDVVVLEGGLVPVFVGGGDDRSSDDVGNVPRRPPPW